MRGVAADGYGLAPQRRIVALLDGCVEGIHVHVKNAAEHVLNEANIRRNLARFQRLLEERDGRNAKG
jgi:hypothetical protein